MGAETQQYAQTFIKIMDMLVTSTVTMKRGSQMMEGSLWVWELGKHFPEKSVLA